jgi:hypothetical protein
MSWVARAPAFTRREKRALARGDFSSSSLAQAWVQPGRRRIDPKAELCSGTVWIGSHVASRPKTLFVSKLDMS